MHASGRLTEVESRSHFLHKIHDVTPVGAEGFCPNEGLTVRDQVIDVLAGTIAPLRSPRET